MHEEIIEAQKAYFPCLRSLAPEVLELGFEPKPATSQVHTIRHQASSAVLLCKTQHSNKAKCAPDPGHKKLTV